MIGWLGCGLLRMLCDAGYSHYSVVLDDPAHRDGPVIALGAAKPAALRSAA